MRPRPISNHSPVYDSQFRSSISRREGEDVETPLAGLTPIDALQDALRVIDTRSDRSAIDMLLNARSVGQILWLSLQARQVRHPRPSSVVGLVKRMHRERSDRNCLEQAAVLAVIAAICVPAIPRASATAIAALSGALPMQFPDVLKPYALEILNAYGERFPAFLKDATDRLEPSAARIDKAFKGYRDQIQRMLHQGSLGQQAHDIGPPPGLVSNTKRTRAEQHENVVAATDKRDKQASAELGAAGQFVTRESTLPRPRAPTAGLSGHGDWASTQPALTNWEIGPVAQINQVQVHALNIYLPSPDIRTLYPPTDHRPFDWTAIPVPDRFEGQPDPPANVQSVFDGTLDTLFMDSQQRSVFLNAPSLQERLPAHQFPAAVQRMVSLHKEQGVYEKDPLKIEWLAYLSERSGMADLEDISLTVPASQAAFAHVLKDLGTSSRRMATTELALGILMKASGALEPYLYKQISDVLMEATEWPGSLAPDLPELLKAANRHLACKPALERMINSCLLNH